ncbi:MAG: hypothetical protein HC789_00520 [Microcoleus sp. CSU_2_2]|nr:hypothetical protein [Microcoleus sp. CSU_2_2]
MRRYEQLSLLLGDLIATHHTNYNGDGKPGFGITGFRSECFTQALRDRYNRT